MKVAFLRGVNVSGKNKVDMKVLKVMLEDFGLTDVKTYLNTGNIIFCGHISVTDFEQLVKEQFGTSIYIILKDLDEIKEISDNYQLSDGSENSYVTMFNRPIDNYYAVIDKKKKEDDLYQIHEDYFYLYVPGGYGKTKITNTYLEKKLDRIGTTRNIKTIRKILKLWYS